MAAFIILYVCFLIISFKLYIAVFATTLIIMQNYRQKSIPPNILILFKKKDSAKRKHLDGLEVALSFLWLYFKQIWMRISKIGFFQAKIIK